MSLKKVIGINACSEIFQDELVVLTTRLIAVSKGRIGEE